MFGNAMRHSCSKTIRPHEVDLKSFMGGANNLSPITQRNSKSYVTVAYLVRTAQLVAH